ncbi:flagellar biosynthesis anti-sigma factor FlgM [Pandoraea sp.]|uniref:flagellar biosynthesis anti-sigma factor FlgM n=1 Tax=Pandoraea sp. TaxID=1883445 RepID=UPI001DA176C4|nr:flagellar biosynthesis anti-sigma factor FlgM [Pandoraea sp.]MBU6494539.1 flagellar biosynthesis anti-sigma factor FlgM [Burkholderiales bacterium]MDE2609376.1 flagellar biosynthesis anti-sigma factor FlgM [Burkholderiales bacterium]
MKIQQSANKVTGTSAVKGGTARTTNNAGAPGPGAAGASAGSSLEGDAVSLSPLASHMQALQTQLAQSGAADIDTARVAELKQAISEGKLAINPDKIASGLINSVRDLLSAQKKS